MHTRESRRCIMIRCVCAPLTHCSFISFNQILLLHRGKSGEKRAANQEVALRWRSLLFNCSRATKCQSSDCINRTPLSKERSRLRISLCFISSSLGFVRVIFCSAGQRPGRLCPHKKCNTVLFFCDCSLSARIPQSRFCCCFSALRDENCRVCILSAERRRKAHQTAAPSTHFQLISKANFAINKSFPGLGARNSIKRSVGGGWQERIFMRREYRVLLDADRFLYQREGKSAEGGIRGISIRIYIWLWNKITCLFLPLN